MEVVYLHHQLDSFKLYEDCNDIISWNIKIFILQMKYNTRQI